MKNFFKHENKIYWQWYLVAALCLFALLLIWGNARRWYSVKVSPAGQEVLVLVGKNKIIAEVASTAEQKSRGLSGREKLDQGHGMWFPFPTGQASAFWMKDMKIPIDIIWVKQGSVVFVNENVPPPVLGQDTNSGLPLYMSPEPADGVLEVNAGWAKEHSVVMGTNVSVKPLE